MDSDELYDSLDDETQQSPQNSPEPLQETVAESSDVNNSKKAPNLQDVSTGNLQNSLLCDISSVVPLYDGETLKDRVKRFGKNPSKKSSVKESLAQNKKFATQPKILNAQRSLCEDAFNVPFHFREQRTYSNIFHARMGRLNPDRKEVTDTARAEWGDQTHRTDVSDVSTHFSDAKSTCSDTTSFYFDLLKNTEGPSKLTESKSTTLKKVNLESPQSSEFNLRSVSQFSINASTITSVSSNSKRSKSRMTIVAPILGSLGPDMEAIQDKLNLLKKRRTYGQKVSDQNRIKMQETKILRDLKYELKKSRL